MAEAKVLEEIEDDIAAETANTMVLKEDPQELALMEQEMAEAAAKMQAGLKVSSSKISNKNNVNYYISYDR